MGCGFLLSNLPKDFPFSIGFGLTLTGPFQGFQECILGLLLSLESPHGPLIHSDGSLFHLWAQRSQILVIWKSSLSSLAIWSHCLYFCSNVILVPESSLDLIFTYLLKTYHKPCLFPQHLSLAKFSSLSIYPASVICSSHQAPPWDWCLERLWFSGLESEGQSINLSLMHISSATLGKLLNLSGPQFPQLQTENASSTYLIGLLWG